MDRNESSPGESSTPTQVYFWGSKLPHNILSLSLIDDKSGLLGPDKKSSTFSHLWLV